MNKAANHGSFSTCFAITRRPAFVERHEPKGRNDAVLAER